MRGHIRKRGDKWTVVVDVGRDEKGRRKQRWHSGFDTRKSAERALTEIMGRLQTGAYVEPTRQLLGEFLRQWLGAMRSSLKPSTWTSYAMLCESYIIPRLGSTPVQALTPAKLNAFYADLLESGAVKTKGKLSTRTVRYTHTVLRKALSEAVRWNLLTRNIADQADPPCERSSSATQMRVWSAVELRAFLDHVADDRLYSAYFLAATTGMRRGEVLGLRWRDVDLDAGRLGVSQTLITVNYELRFSTPKTDRGRRSVALDPMTVVALRAHRTRQLEERLAADTYQDSDLVFAREDGTPFHPDRFSDLFDHYVRTAGVPRIRLHDLRHTHATLALQAGVHPKVVSERLGHSTISITLDTYSHAIPAMQEEAASRVAGLVFGS